MKTVTLEQIIVKNVTNGTARVNGQTHVVERKNGEWVITFTHLEGCACNYCNGDYDYLIQK